MCAQIGIAEYFKLEALQNDCGVPTKCLRDQIQGAMKDRNLTPEGKQKRTCEKWSKAEQERFVALCEVHGYPSEKNQAAFQKVLDRTIKSLQEEWRALPHPQVPLLLAPRCWL